MELNENLKIGNTKQTLSDLVALIPLVKLFNFETKEFENATWMKVYYTNSNNGSVVWTNMTELLNTFQTYKWSILGMIDNFYNNDFGGYEFLLEYPELDGYVRWRQTSNPTRTDQAVTGYSLVSHNINLNYGWGGLSKSSRTTETLIDGSPSDSTWYYSIGQLINYDGGIPANGPNVQQVYLWIRIK